MDKRGTVQERDPCGKEGQVCWEKNIPSKGPGVAEPVILKEQPGLYGWSKELK